MSEKKYAERQAQAAHVIKEQYLLLNQIYNENNTLNYSRLTFYIKKMSLTIQIFLHNITIPHLKPNQKIFIKTSRFHLDKT